MNQIKLPKNIEPLFGLWVLFELKKLSKRYQNKVVKEIKNGEYPRNKKL
jgi:hypothetical protein